VRAFGGPGYIYLMACGPVIKLGWSQDPDKRCREIHDQARPFVDELDIHTLRIVKGTQTQELLLHKRFEEFKRVGEWYPVALQATLEQAIDAHVAAHALPVGPTTPDLVP